MDMLDVKTEAQKADAAAKAFVNRQSSWIAVHPELTLWLAIAGMVITFLAGLWMGHHATLSTP